MYNNYYKCAYLWMSKYVSQFLSIYIYEVWRLLHCSSTTSDTGKNAIQQSTNSLKLKDFKLATIIKIMNVTEGKRKNKSFSSYQPCYTPANNRRRYRCGTAVSCWCKKWSSTLQNNKNEGSIYEVTSVIKLWGGLFGFLLSWPTTRRKY